MRYPTIDPRVDYVKLEKEKLLTSFYIAGYKGSKFKCKENDANYNEYKESYELGLKDKNE